MSVSFLPWIHGHDALELQGQSSLHIDSKSLEFSSTAELRITNINTWYAIHGLLGLQKHQNGRTYLGAPHPQFIDVVNGVEYPMLWGNSINVTPAGYYLPMYLVILNFALGFSVIHPKKAEVWVYNKYLSQ